MSEQSNSKVLESLKQGKEIFWPNPDLLAFEEALAKGPYSFADVQDVENRLQRFAPFIQKAFPETVESQGIIESTVTHIPEMKEWLSTYYNQDFAGGE